MGVSHTAHRVWCTHRPTLVGAYGGCAHTSPRIGVSQYVLCTHRPEWYWEWGISLSTWVRSLWLHVLGRASDCGRLFDSTPIGVRLVFPPEGRLSLFGWVLREGEPFLVDRVGSSLDRLVLSLGWVSLVLNGYRSLTRLGSVAKLGVWSEPRRVSGGHSCAMIWVEAKRVRGLIGRHPCLPIRRALVLDWPVLILRTWPIRSTMPLHHRVGL